MSHKEVQHKKEFSNKNGTISPGMWSFPTEKGQAEVTCYRGLKGN